MRALALLCWRLQPNGLDQWFGRSRELQEMGDVLLKVRLSGAPAGHALVHIDRYCQSSQKIVAHRALFVSSDCSIDRQVAKLKPVVAIFE